MGRASAGCPRRLATLETIQTETSATTIPASTSSQKWLAVASTQNQTQAGQSAQIAFDHQLRDTRKRKIPTISASAAWRLGNAAYGFANAPRPVSGVTPSRKPHRGYIQDGPVV